MDAQAQERWNSWAKSIARAEAEHVIKIANKVIADAVQGKLNEQAQRIDELERELAALKQRQAEPAEEWPLKSIAGGRQ